MKHKLYKQIITFLALGFIGTAFAQKFDKKFTENFKTNKEVEVAINASNTDINVTVWDKNEVQIDAFIEIEGITKEEAEKYFKDWEFEALGNSKKVKITSKGNGAFNFKNDFVFFDGMNFDFKMPDIDFSNIEAIILPDMDFDFDFDFDFEDIIDLDDNIGENGRYDFIWNDGDDIVVIKSKEDWDAFKKTKRYKELKEKMSLTKEKMRRKFSVSKEEMKQKIQEAKKRYKKIDREEIEQELAKAKELLQELNFNFKSKSNFNSDDVIINGKNIKIKKRLEIKVPKGATFDLNTRHCKVKLPNTVAFGNVKYGSFDANNLFGGKLTVDYSTVTINNLNACTLFLNNVTDANIASVTNTTISNNSSGVNIIKINENVNLSDKFGELTIDSFNPNFGEFILNLSQSNATLILGDVASKFKYQVNRVKMDNQNMKKAKKNTTTKNVIKVTGDYSSIVIK